MIANHAAGIVCGRIGTVPVEHTRIRLMHLLPIAGRIRHRAPRHRNMAATSVRRLLARRRRSHVDWANSASTTGRSSSPTGASISSMRGMPPTWKLPEASAMHSSSESTAIARCGQSRDPRVPSCLRRIGSGSLQHCVRSDFRDSVRRGDPPRRDPYGRPRYSLCEGGDDGYSREATSGARHIIGSCCAGAGRRGTDDSTGLEGRSTSSLIERIRSADRADEGTAQTSDASSRPFWNDFTKALISLRALGERGSRKLRGSQVSGGEPNRSPMSAHRLLITAPHNGDRTEFFQRTSEDRERDPTPRRVRDHASCALWCGDHRVTQLPSFRHLAITKGLVSSIPSLRPASRSVSRGERHHRPGTARSPDRGRQHHASEFSAGRASLPARTLFKQNSSARACGSTTRI